MLRNVALAARMTTMYAFNAAPYAYLNKAVRQRYAAFDENKY